MRRWTFLLAAITTLGLIATGCGQKSPQTEPRNTKPVAQIETAQPAASQSAAHPAPTIEQLSADLDSLQNLYKQLEQAYKSNMDETSWRQWSAKWNRDRQSLFDKMKVSYDPAQGQTDIIAQGNALVSAAAALYILWQEYTNYLTGSPADPGYLNSEFVNYTSQVKEFLEQHK